MDTAVAFRAAAEKSALERRSERALLSAEWRDLVMLNYEVDADALAPLVPHGTELDLWQGKMYASIVGFMFLNARLCGVRVPLHGKFEEVNLRFYVRRECSDGWRRGVVFVRELAPRRAVSLVACKLYGENYLTVPMTHCIKGREPHGTPRRIEYSWEWLGGCGAALLQVDGEPRRPDPGSFDEFIVDHYWAYTARPRGTTEYRVEHPPWQTVTAGDAEFHCNASAALFGPQLAPALRRPPASAFYADGSPVRVFKGRWL